MTVALALVFQCKLATQNPRKIMLRYFWRTLYFQRVLSILNSYEPELHASARYDLDELGVHMGIFTSGIVHLHAREESNIEIGGLKTVHTS